MARGSGGALGWDELHAAAARLEEHLASLPYDRALPDLDAILRAADVPVELLRQDERARKLLHEAILARPLASHAAVEQRRVEVELLTLEVSVLTATLSGRGAGGSAPTPDEVTRAARRLVWIRTRLEELRADL